MNNCKICALNKLIYFGSSLQESRSNGGSLKKIEIKTSLIIRKRKIHLNSLEKEEAYA